MTTPLWDPAELLKLSGGYWATCALHAGVKLDLFSPLAQQPRTVEELATGRELSPRGLVMLLDALCALELLTRDGESYQTTPSAAAYLDRAAPGYIGHIIMHHHHLIDGWAQLDQAVRSGQQVGRRITQEAPEEERESFQLGMFNLAMLIAPQVAAQVDLKGRRHLLDLGGGPGTYAIHFCLQNPVLLATIFDLPSTRPFAEATVARFALQQRIDFVAGDFDQEGPLPGRYDVVWLSHVLHADGPQGCAALLRKAVAALEPGGLLLVQEFILDADRAAPLFPALFSLNMLLVTPNGQSYSEPELFGMLHAAGLQRIERLPVHLPNGAGIIAGHKA